ncbi:MAG: GAF domain-containing protein, partial [Stellaceae bacterium]
MSARLKKATAAPRRTVAELDQLLLETRAEQAATAEILDIINHSSGDPAPVFDAILERAMRLCEAPFGGLVVPDDEFIRYVAIRNAPKPFADFLTRERVRLKTMLGLNVLKGMVLHVADLSQSEAYRRRIPVTVSAVEDGGIRAVLCVPLMRDGGLIGAFTLYRQEVRPFTDREIALAWSFAAQAAIAMENARLIDEINSRNRDLTQSLERQTATSEILGAIAAAPGDAKGTLRKIAETTARLFRAAGVSFRIAEGDEFKLSIGVGRGAEQVSTQLYADPTSRPKVGGHHLPGAVIRENRQINIPDLDHLDPEFADWPGTLVARDAGIRTVVGSPLRAEGRAIGALIVYRDVPRPFEPVELQLLQSFADQAVIAIENARLLTELQTRTADLQESLTYQTATSDVLKVISRSTFDLQPVLDTLVKTAGHLCVADAGALSLREGDTFRYLASIENGQLWRALAGRSFTPGRETVAGRVILEGKAVHIADAREAPELHRHPGRTAPGEARTELNEAHSALGVPMLREGEIIGVLTLTRNHVEPFTERQIDLVRTFADQAVIAIENARLLTELRESLEQQQAIAEVLQAINASPGNLAPVFEAILEKAHTLCGASRGALFIIEGDTIR